MAHYRLVFGRLDKRPCLKNGILNNPSVLPNIKSESFYITRYTLCIDNHGHELYFEQYL